MAWQGYLPARPLTVTRFAKSPIEDGIGTGQAQPWVVGFIAHYLDDGQNGFLGVVARQFAQMLEGGAAAIGTGWPTGAFALTAARIPSFGGRFIPGIFTSNSQAVLISDAS